MAVSTTTLPKDIFALEVTNHDLIQRAYERYLANGRTNLAQTKTRGLVRGGGRKPWRQKGTGRARFGSTRNPIWRGGGIVFGPTGNENYTKGLSTAQKRQAIKQALSLAHQAKKVTVVTDFKATGKVKDTAKFINDHKLSRNILLVVDEKNALIERSTRNLENLKVSQALYLNVYDILNADNLVITDKALVLIKSWLSNKTPAQENAS